MVQRSVGLLAPDCGVPTQLVHSTLRAADPRVNVRTGRIVLVPHRVRTYCRLVGLKDTELNTPLSCEGYCAFHHHFVVLVDDQINKIQVILDDQLRGTSTKRQTLWNTFHV